MSQGQLDDRRVRRRRRLRFWLLFAFGPGIVIGFPILAALELWANDLGWTESALHRDPARMVGTRIEVVHGQATRDGYGCPAPWFEPPPGSEGAKWWASSDRPDDLGMTCLRVVQTGLMSKRYYLLTVRYGRDGHVTVMESEAVNRPY